MMATQNTSAFNDLELTTAFMTEEIELSHELDGLHTFYFVLTGIVGSCICCLGLVGNLFNIIIFGRMLRSYNSATNIFLLAIAITDLLALAIYLLYDIMCIAIPEKPLIDLHDMKPALLGTFVYFLYYTWLFPANVFITSSNWFTVSVMVFRFIAIYIPLKASQWCTPRRAHVVLVIISTLSVLTVIPDCFTIRLTTLPVHGFIITDTKLAANKYFQIIYHITYVETINSIVPFIICFILSGLLIRALQRSQRLLGLDSTIPQRSKRQKNQRRISIMLLVIVLSFIVCTIPAFVWRGMKHAVLDKKITEDVWIMMRAVADVFLIINHSAKFPIYMFTNIMYRKSFRQLILCRGSDKSDASNSLFYSRWSERRSQHQNSRKINLTTKHDASPVNRDYQEETCKLLKSTLYRPKLDIEVMDQHCKEKKTLILKESSGSDSIASSTGMAKSTSD